MIRRLRIAVLLYLLAFVAAGHYLTALRTTDWDAPLWVDIYPVNGDGSERTQRFLDNLQEQEFERMEQFFAREAGRHALGLERPFRVSLAPQIRRTPPQAPAQASMLRTLLWSLRMRWFATSLRWEADRPAPDITLFAVYHDETQAATLDRSTALRKGLIAVANLFAEDEANRGPNQLIMAHELLHTVGARDKYDPATNAPLFPDGYADPQARPLHPQARAEIMGGRIPIDAHEARIPVSLNEVLIGAATAAEIRWTAPVR